MKQRPRPVKQRPRPAHGETAPPRGPLYIAVEALPLERLLHTQHPQHPQHPAGPQRERETAGRPTSLLGGEREKHSNHCDDLPGLQPERVDPGPVSVSGGPGERGSVRVRSGAVSGAGLQRSLYMLLLGVRG